MYRKSFFLKSRSRANRKPNTELLRLANANARRQQNAARSRQCLGSTCCGNTGPQRVVHIWPAPYGEALHPTRIYPGTYINLKSNLPWIPVTATRRHLVLPATILIARSLLRLAPLLRLTRLHMMVSIKKERERGSLPVCSVVKGFGGNKSLVQKAVVHREIFTLTVTIC